MSLVARGQLEKKKKKKTLNLDSFARQNETSLNIKQSSIKNLDTVQARFDSKRAVNKMG